MHSFTRRRKTAKEKSPDTVPIRDQLILSRGMWRAWGRMRTGCSARQRGWLRTTCCSALDLSISCSAFYLSIECSALDLSISCSAFYLSIECSALDLSISCSAFDLSISCSSLDLNIVVQLST
jgi:hypothetical protein